MSYTSAKVIVEVAEGSPKATVKNITQKSENPTILNKKQKSIGINTGFIGQVRLNPNLRSAWGLCEKTNIPKRFNLAFSERLLQASEKGVYTVILHELLHTCKDCFRHTGQWKFYANEVSNRLGYNITRTSSSKDLGVDFSSIPEGMFACVCNGCGSLVTRKTLKGIISLEKNYCCGCGGSFERVV